MFSEWTGWPSWTHYCTGSAETSLSNSAAWVVVVVVVLGGVVVGAWLGKGRSFRWDI